MPTIALTYARISPRPTESESLETQRRELAEFAGRNGWTVRLHFEDDRISGSELVREGLQDALRAIRSGEVLVVRDLSRFARDVTVALALEAELKRIGAYLATYQQGIVLDPTSDPISYHYSILPRFVEHWASHLERLVKNARTSTRMREHQTNGRPMGGHAPFGWRIVDGKLVEDPNEQAAARRARELRDHDGLSFGKIAAVLGSEGFQPRGDTWYSETVRRMLKEA